MCGRTLVMLIVAYYLGKMGKRELIALLNLSSWCLVMVERLFLAAPQGCLQFVIVVSPDHSHYFCDLDFGHSSIQIVYRAYLLYYV